MSIRVDAEVNENDLAYSIAFGWGTDGGTYQGLIDFIVDVDEYVCDLRFTKALLDRLSGILEEEES